MKFTQWLLTGPMKFPFPDVQAIFSTEAEAIEAAKEWNGSEIDFMKIGSGKTSRLEPFLKRKWYVRKAEIALTPMEDN